MDNQPLRSTVLDLITLRLAPGWSRWSDGDDCLVSELRDRPARSHQVVWMLDRLLPLGQRDDFEPLLPSPGAEARHGTPVRAIYAYLRRAPEPTALLQHTPRVRGNLLLQDAMAAAWCDLLSDRPPEELLTWWRLCDEHDLQAGQSALILREYTRREAAPEQRLALLLPFAEEHHETWTSERGRLTATQRLAHAGMRANDRRRAVRWALDELVRTAACRLPRPEDELPSTESASKWLEACLVDAGLPSLARLVMASHTDEKGLAQRLWIERQTSPEALVERLDDIEERLQASALWRLRKILPPETLAEWWNDHRLSLRSGGMRVLCDGLPAEHRDVLVPMLDDRDHEVAACAYHAWLHRAPAVVLKAEWDRVDQLPAWRGLALDRFLFAPKPLRPPPWVDDVNAVYNDPRLADPLNDRGY